jgi:hypothetical protein
MDTLFGRCQQRVIAALLSGNRGSPGFCRVIYTCLLQAPGAIIEEIAAAEICRPNLKYTIMNSYLGNRSCRVVGKIARLSHFIVLSVVLALAQTRARAATLTVTNTNDSGVGLLRAAIAAATNGDTIVFALPAPSTIMLTSGALAVSQSVTITGPGPSALAISGGGSNLVFSIAQNKASVSLGGLTITNGQNGIYVANEASASLSNVVVIGNAGTGISCYDGYVQIVGSTITGNTNLSGDGGGIFLEGEMVTCTLAMTNSTITANAATNGGGIFVTEALGNVSTYFSNVIISSNLALLSGGGICGYGAPLNLANLTLAGNSARGGGGGIENFHSGLTISNVTVMGNSSYAGGGIYVDGTIEPAGSTLINSTISSNFAGFGAGIYNAGHEAAVNMFAYNCTFSENRAVYDGGAFHADGTGGLANLVVVGSTISGNTAPLGGGAYNYAGAFQDNGSSVLAISNSTFSGNLAGNGGAIYNLCLSPTSVGPRGMGLVQIFNSTFSGNSATNGGGTLYNTNYGIGSVQAQIGSSILNAGQFGGTVLAPADTVTSLGYNLSSDAAGGFLGNTGDRINTNPMLGPLQDNGGAVFTQALLPGSPAIDQGFNFSGLPNDGRGLGFVRTYDYPAITNAAGGDGTDIGAFELQPGTTDFATWQLQYFGGTNNPQAAPTADPDGDGANNMNEFLAGTNPRNSASVFRVLSVAPQGKDLLVTWQTAGGHTNVLQSSGSLVNGSFSDTSPAIVIPGIGDATNSYLETGAALNGSNGFYRVRLGQ